jgi:hypothetical protein
MPLFMSPAVAVALAQLSVVTVSEGNAHSNNRLGTATVLPDGRVLFTGGEDIYSNVLANTWLFDPLTGSFDAGPALPQARLVHSAVLLPSGDVLLAGGGSSQTLIYSFQTGQWLDGGVLPGGDRSDAQLLRLADGTVVFAGGRDPGMVGSPNVDVRDPVTGQWSAAPSLPAPNSRACALVFEDGGAAIFGGGGTRLDAYATWARWSGGRFVDAGTLRLPRADLNCVRAAGDVVTLIGGVDGGGVGGDIDGGGFGVILDEDVSLVSGTSTTSLALPRATRDFAFGLLPSGTTVAADGENMTDYPLRSLPPGAGWRTQQLNAIDVTLASAVALPTGRMMINGGNSQALLLIDELIMQATPTMAMPRPLARFSSVTLPDGRVLVLGGDDGSATPTDAVWRYDETLGAWADAGHLTVPRLDAAAALLLDGRVLVAGGLGAGNALLDSVEVFDPLVGAAAGTGQLLSARSGASAVTLGDGTVAVLAGEAADAGVGLVELFDPVSGQAQAAGAILSTPGVVTLRLRDGEVLVAGGQQDRVQLWRGDGGTVDIANPFGGMPRRSPALVLLPGAREVLIAGGYDSTGTARTDALRLDLATFAARKATSLVLGNASPGVVLHSGEVFVPYGGGTSALQRYDPIADQWPTTPPGPTGYTGVAARPLRSGRALMFGGTLNGTLTSSSALFQEEGPVGLPRPSATPSAASASQGDTLALAGLQLLGPALMGGATTEQTSWDEVVFALESLEGQDVRLLESHAQSSTAATAVLPTDLLPGWYWIWPTVHGVSGTAEPLFIGRPLGSSCTADAQCASRACDLGRCMMVASSVDGGPGSDAGMASSTDGGRPSADGGAADAGALDSVRSYRASCGCGATGPAPLAVVALVGLALFRARRPGLTVSSKAHAVRLRHAARFTRSARR